MPDRMLDRMSEFTSDRMPDRLPERMSADCSKQSHAINVKLKCEGSKYAVRIETRPDNP